MSNRYESELSAFQDEVWSSLEKYGRKLGWGLSGIQPENWILLDHAVDELVKLRDQLRWRDAKTEKPQEGELCLIVMRNMIWPNVIQYSEFGSYRSPWDTDFILYWRPIGELPGGE